MKARRPAARDSRGDLVVAGDGFDIRRWDAATGERR
jgi:hypothetical protein